MVRTRSVRSFALVLTTFVALSCSEYSPTGPAAPATASDGLLSGLVSTVTGVLGSVLKVIGYVYDPNGIEVRAVKWAPTHVNQVRTTSATIGYWGGTLAIPGSDFTIKFPVGALSTSTQITITSDGGGYVSYDMQPHGIRFAKPVIVTQRLSNTAVYGTSDAFNAFGAYLDKRLARPERHTEGSRNRTDHDFLEFQRTAGSRDLAAQPLLALHPRLGLIASQPARQAETTFVSNTLRLTAAAENVRRI